MKKEISIIAITFMLAACGNKHIDVPVPAPSAAVLLTPAQNALCIAGVALSDSVSTVAFTWEPSKNSSSYELKLTNLLTSALTSYSSAGPTLSINIARNTPYSWYVVSKSTQTATTAQSATWKFYNAGAGVVTYAPFPADIISPVYGEVVNATAGAVNLSWTGSSVNAYKIMNYDVYFGATKTVTLLKGAITDSFLNSVSVTSGTTYYWKIITRDMLGNTSDSGLYVFSVN